MKIVPPLDTVAGLERDHKCVYVRNEFPRERNFTWIAKFKRTRTRASEEAFAADLSEWDWSCLRSATSVDRMAEELEKGISTLTERHFPLVRVRRRSNEDPWISHSIRRLWKKKMRICKKFGKSQSWWETDQRLQTEIANAKEFFVAKMLEEGNRGRPFYAATRKLAAASPGQPWSVTDLFVGMEPAEVGREVLGFFGGLARSDAEPMPRRTRVSGGLGFFSIDRTSTLLLLGESKKTDSRVEGDPLPHLIRSFPNAFAAPVAEIYNMINESGEWPARWKTEHLTIIPKNPNPVDLSECRNISCTSAFSKILEGQVLVKLRNELAPDMTQYGGVPKCGVEHMLIDLWEEVLEGLEGGKSAAVLLGVDYKKAFNRMEHAACLTKLEELGASEGSLTLVKAFLEGRTMQITIDGHTLPLVPIQRGSPQGSVLGCLLYCATTQKLTESIRQRPGGQVTGVGGEARVHPPGPTVFMYVDDTTLVDVVQTEEAALHITTAATNAHFGGLALEEDFAVLESRAEEIKMKGNAKKTELLVIAPTNGNDYTASINTANHTIESVKKMKLVGFTFGPRPGASEHVMAIEDKIRRKVWMLYKLRSAGFKGDSLFKLYCCYLRSIIEYCSVLYHAMLTGGQSWDLERLQRLAIRICYGNASTTDELMASNAVETLEERRARRCDIFLRKNFNHTRFGNVWFLPRLGERRDLRRRRAVEETRATTLRRFNSPLAFLKRRANELGLSR